MHGEKGKSLSERALDLARELNDPLSEAKALWNLMLLSYFHGENAEQALAYGEESLEIAREHNFREQMAYTLHDLARVYGMTGKFERAREVQDEARENWRDLGNQPMLADNLTSSGYLHLELGNYEIARDQVEEATRISLAIGNQWGQAYSGSILGPIYLELGEFSKSIETMRKAEQSSIESNSVFSKIILPALLAWTYAMLGDLDASRDSIKRALEDTDQTEVFKARVLAAEAWMHYINDDLEMANKRMEESAKGLQLDSPDLFVGSLIQSFELDIVLANEQYQIAVDKAAEYLAIMDQDGRRLFRADLLLRKGKGLLALGKREEADEYFREAYREAESLGSLRSLLSILAVRYHFAIEAGDENEAAALQEEGRALVGTLQEKIDDSELREKFLQTADVQVFMD
jgi:tetratricopeptide (TPR) repeat protein